MDHGGGWSRIGAGLAYAFTWDVSAAVYTVVVCIMAALAAHSRFPQRVGAGAGLFVVSDLLIFAQMGPMHDDILPWLLIWPFYFTGQVLIAHGVVTTLRKEQL